MPMTFARFWTRLAALALCLAVAAPASAQAMWKQFMADDIGTYHIDRASIAREGEWTTVTSRSDYIGEGIKDGIHRRVYNEVFDCRKSAVRLRKMTLYGADGKVLNAFEWGEDEMDWIPINPGSLGARKLEEVCD